MFRLLLPLCLLFGTSAAADCPAEVRSRVGLYVRIDSNVEAHVCRAVLAAVERLPEAHRELLGMLTVLRLSDPPGLEASTVAQRVRLGMTLAVYLPHSHTLVVTDNGAAGEPQWRGAAPTLAQARAFLADLGPPSDLESAVKAQERWQALGARLEPGMKRFARAPADVLRALVRAGATQLYGQELTLGVALDHSLARLAFSRSALRGGGIGTLAAFAELSNWTDRSALPGEIPDYTRRPLAMEWVEAMLGHTETNAYSVASGAEFASPLARLSPTLDLCESYRLARSRPESVPPAKLMAVNAAIWFAAPREGRRPTHFPGAFRGKPGARRLLTGATHLLGDGERQPGIGAVEAVAVVGAHAGLLAPMADGLPRNPAPRLPVDVPSAVAQRLSPEAMSVQLGAVLLRPAAHRVQATLIRLLRRYEREAPTLRDPRVLAAIARVDDEGRAAFGTLEEVLGHLTKVTAYERVQYQRVIARAYARAGAISTATSLVDSIRGSLIGGRERVQALIDIAQGYIMGGEWGPVSGVLDKAARLISAGAGPTWRAQLWADLARAYAQAGHYTKGVEMLSRLRGLGGTGPLADLVHVELAGWLAGEGRFEPAAKMLDTAIARLAEVGPVGLRARLARAVSVALARMGRVSTAVRLARSVDTAVRIAVLAGAGAQCARLRDEAGWKTIWTEAREKGAPGERVRTLLALTRAVVASSGYERAAPCLAAAKQAALAERRPGPRSIALNEVATLYCELEQFDVADRLSRKIQWYYLDAPDVRARLAESMARNGDWKQAMKWVRAVPSLDERERIAALVKRLVKREESPRAP